MVIRLPNTSNAPTYCTGASGTSSASTASGASATSGITATAPVPTEKNTVVFTTKAPDTRPVDNIKWDKMTTASNGDKIYWKDEIPYANSQCTITYTGEVSSDSETAWASGASGASGARGASGASGATGASGASGASGISELTTGANAISFISERNYKEKLLEWCLNKAYEMKCSGNYRNKEGIVEYEFSWCNITTKVTFNVYQVLSTTNVTYDYKIDSSKFQ